MKLSSFEAMIGKSPSQEGDLGGWVTRSTLRKKRIQPKQSFFAEK